jgi:hypothetical protein
LVQKVEGQVARVTAVRFLNKEEGFLTINEDKSLRVLLKRDTGQFWPSIVDYLPTVPSSLCFHEESSTWVIFFLTLKCFNLFSVFVGLINGAILHYVIAEDMNKLEMVRRFQSHTHSVNGIVYLANEKQLLSCSRDKTIMWHSTETGHKLGIYIFKNYLKIFCLF